MDQVDVNNLVRDGHYYTVTVAGTVDFGDGAIAFAVDDRVFYNGEAWRKIYDPVSGTVLAHPSTGVFYVDQHVAQAGLWRYWSESAGARAGERSSFRVEALEP